MNVPTRWARRIAEPLLDATRPHRWARRKELYNFVDQPRKTPAAIRSDLRTWQAKYGMCDFSYFEYGADIEGRDIDRYMPYVVFKEHRNATNRTLVGPDDFSYECLLEDKTVFERYARACGHATPETRAVFTSEGFVLPGSRETLPADTFADVFPEFSGILKPITGGGGADVFRIVSSDGVVRVNGEPTDLAVFCKSFRAHHILQAFIQQHDALAALNASSVNTLRLLTVRDEHGARPLSAVLKAGSVGGWIDNVQRGGLAVLVDLKRGALRGRGILSPGNPTVAAHPDSGVVLDGYAVPHLDAAVRAACAFHEDLYGFHSIGWDIAITDDGPLIIEGNNTWSGYFHFTLDPDFLARYLETLGPLPPQPYRHQHAPFIR